jgi:hypothetical protein
MFPFFLTERKNRAQLEDDFSRQEMTKQAKLKVNKIEYTRGMLTRLAPDKKPNNTSIFSVHALAPEDRPGLVLAGEIAEGDSHCSDPVASEHKQIPIFATTVVM